MTHAVLLGDSIFDNRFYTDGDPDVVSHLRTLLEPEGQATLLARDGALISEVPNQLARIPSTASHLFVSMGGNDALNSISLLGEAAASVAHALARFAGPLDRFDDDYANVLQKVVDLGLPTTLCTIYNGAFAPGLERDSVTVAVRLFNDSITRHGRGFGVPVIELRSICTETADYWNPIEPSGQGGAKIAAAVASRLTD